MWRQKRCSLNSFRRNCRFLHYNGIAPLIWTGGTGNNVQVFSCYYVFSGVYLHPSPFHMDVPLLIIICIAFFASVEVASLGLYSHAQRDCWVFGLNCKLKEKRVENENNKKTKQKRPPTIVEAWRFITSAAVWEQSRRRDPSRFT